jgi:hypothetical protein
LLFQKPQVARIAPESRKWQTAQNQSIITTNPNEVEGSEDKQRDERFNHK